MDSRAIIKKLEQRGWRHVRMVGSHHIFEHPDYPEIVTVPHPKKDLPPGTLRGILKTGRIERKEIRKRPARPVRGTPEREAA